MARFLSLPVIGNPTQALTQVQTRLDGIFGRNRVELEYVRDGAGVLTEIIVILTDNLLAEDIRAFRRALDNIDGRVGLAVDVPPGGSSASGAVAGAQASTFDVQAAGGSPSGFNVIGGVTVGGGTSTGPNLIHTDGGGGATLDLSTTPITVSLPIQPGTLLIDLDIGTAETITDDGLGVLTGTTGSLPGDGTIDYVTGAMTGTTAALTISSTVDETHTTDVSLSPAQSANLDSGAAAGNAALIYAVNKAIGRPVNQLNWTFNVLFSSDFGLNNNAVSGAKALTLEARLLGAAAGQDIILRWGTLSDDAAPPAAWGTPVFVNVLPSVAPTGALAIDIDAVWHEIVIRRVDTNVLGVAYDGTEELFTFAGDLVVPSKVMVNHNWSDALDKSFNIDDWSFSFNLASPA